MANDGVLEAVSNSASENYDYDIERDCADCTSWVKVLARYNDPWETPMAGAPFRILQDGEVIEESTLKSISDLGKNPGDPLTDDERALLGTFTKQNVPPGAITFEIIQEGSEGHVLALEQQCVELTARSVRKIEEQYAEEWSRWREAERLGQANLLIQSAVGGFLEGVEQWWDEEKGFWDMIADVFATAWQAIKDAIGDTLTALHPDNIAATAEAVWDGLRSGIEAIHEGAEAMLDAVSGLPEKLSNLYAGTVRLLNNIGEITRFLEAFVTGDWRGVEEFVQNTLPSLIEDETEAAHWAEYIVNNAEAWQVVLEIIGYTKGPALILAACAGICAAVPPQVWAHFGIASVTVIVIEIAISAVIGFLAAAATAASGGAATVAAGALIVGRAGKWAQLASKGAEHIGNLMTHLDEIIQRVVTMGQASMRARRYMTRTQGRRDGATNHETEQRRDEDSGLCRNCGTRLGVGRHPDHEPNFRNGNTSKGDNYRSRLQRHTLFNPSSIGSRPALVSETQVHHLLSEKGVADTGKSRKLERLGYNINVIENLSLIPKNGYLACHLRCQIHLGDHAWGSYSYHRVVEMEIDDIVGDLQHYCLQRPPENDIQPDMNAKSAILAAKISTFIAPLSQVASDFQSGSLIGCSNTHLTKHTGTPCAHLRDHSQRFATMTLSVPYSIEAGK